MHPRGLVRRLALVSALALATAILTPAPTTAAPVFTLAEFASDTFAHDDGPNCTPTETSSPDVVDVPVVENGPAVTFTGSGSATLQHHTVPGDTAGVTATATITSKLTSVGTNLGTIGLTAQGSGTVTTALPASACEIHAGVGGTIGFTFVVAQPGWLTVDTELSEFSSRLELYSASSNPYINEYNLGFEQSSTRRIFLPADTYNGAMQTYLEVFSSTSMAVAGHATIRASFAVAGSQTVAPTGKGAKYVGLGTRSCVAHTVAGAITRKGKRADKVSSVMFLVNDKRVLRDGNPKKGEAYSLPVASDEDVDVTAVVKLHKSKPGKPAKTKEVTSSYTACS